MAAVKKGVRPTGHGIVTLRTLGHAMAFGLILGIPAALVIVAAMHLSCMLDPRPLAVRPEEFRASDPICIGRTDGHASQTPKWLNRKYAT